MIFKIDKKGRGIWTIHPVLRGSLCLIAAFSGMACILPLTEENSPSIFQVLLFLFMLLSAAYRDYWIFDPNKKTILAANGLACIVKKHRLPFDQIESILLTSVYQGKAKLLYIKCSLNIKNGRQVPVIDQVKGRSAASLIKRAQGAAAILGCTIEEKKL